MFTISNKQAEELNRNFQIPVQPAILLALQEERRKERPDPAVIAELISCDITLSASILKTINSPVFGLNRSVSDIKQSVILLGIDNVSNLVTFFELRQAMQGEACISMESFWNTALEVARLTGLLLEYLELKSYCPVEDAYAIGLFSNCGLPLMAMRYPDYKRILQLGHKYKEIVLTRIEDRKYGCNHAVVGYFLTSSWRLPKHLCELILQHHDPEFFQLSHVTDLQKDLYGILKIANNIQSKLECMGEDPEWFQVKDKVLAHFDLTQESYWELEDDLKAVFYD